MYFAKRCFSFIALLSRLFGLCFYFSIQTTNTATMLCTDDINAHPQLTNFYNFPIDDADADTSTTAAAVSVAAPTAAGSHRSQLISELPRFVHSPHVVVTPTAKPRRSVFAPFANTDVRHNSTLTTAASVANLTLVSQLSGVTGRLAASAAAPTARQVHVTHIDTPHRFYVQSIGDHAAANQLRELCMADATATIAPQRIERDDRLLLTSADGNGWYRVRIDDVRTGPNRKEYEVFYLDVGRTERVHQIARFRPMGWQLTARPAAARACSLHSLRPLSGGIWRKDARILMATIVGQ